VAVSKRSHGDIQAAFSRLSTCLSEGSKFELTMVTFVRGIRVRKENCCFFKVVIGK